MKTIFITVGSTKFDHLISSVLEASFLMNVKSNGYDKVILQYGSSKVSCDIEKISKETSIRIEMYDYKNTIMDDIQKADLIICHSGAGTLLEVLRLKKPAIAVINEQLMDNHQKELAFELDRHEYLIAAVPKDLALLFTRGNENSCLKRLDNLKTYPNPNTSLFYGILDEEAGKNRFDLWLAG